MYFVIRTLSVGTVNITPNYTVYTTSGTATSSFPTPLCSLRHYAPPAGIHVDYCCQYTIARDQSNVGLSNDFAIALNAKNSKTKTSTIADAPLLVCVPYT